MYREIKEFELMCDIVGCNTSTIVKARSDEYGEDGPYHLPNGWGTEQISGCGLTGYTRTDVLCPNCMKKKKR